MNLTALSPGMFDVIRRTGNKAVTAREMGVEGALMASLVNRGFLLADKNGEPAIYTLSEMGLGAYVAMTAPVIPRDCEGMISRIQRTVATYYGLPIIEMVSQRRSRRVARPRQVAMWLTRTLTTHSLPTIGLYFGGRDHTTVLHAVRTIDGLCQINRAYADEVYAFLDVLVPETEMAA